MGKGRPRAVEKGVLGHNCSVSSSGSLNIPSGPVYYPTQDEFRDPLEYIYKIRPEAEPYGICKIVPPETWKPPFALNCDSFTFPTKTQAIHQLQARPAASDSKTFELEYNRFLEDHGGKKLRKKVVFEGEELDLCKLFNAVKRYGGYNKVVKEKKWGEVSRFVRSTRKISECAKHVLSQLYREHLYDYEKYYNRLNQKAGGGGYKRALHDEGMSDQEVESLGSKRRRRNNGGDKVKKVCKVKEEEHDQICEQCRSGLHGEVMLLCDRCNKGWHIYCLSPPLKQVPPGNWYCLECLNSDKDCFGFVPGKQYSLEAFRRVADRAKKRWFGSGPASLVQIEKKFWEIVEGMVGEVEVIYGSDLDTSIYGSGFPRANDQRPQIVEAKIWDEYCDTPWNINNLPKLSGSMLRAVHQNITGVMVPWLYIGMLFSAFCWHFEDHCFYSMNYLHWGEPKCWYSVPGSEANAFEKVMRKSLPDLFDAQPDLLFQLVTMLNPSVLQENGVPVYSILQEPGNFVITFPRSYHGGFNLGLNCAEAVNFAPADWLPYGRIGADLYKQYRKAAVLSHEELLCVVAKNDCNSRVSPYLKRELLKIHANEKSWRERLWKNGIIRSSPMSPRKCLEYVGTEEDPTCIICKQYLYLSAVVCRCRPSAFVCLEHWERLCECKSSKLRLLYRHTLAELYGLVLTVDKHCCEETTQSRNMRRQISSSGEQNALAKKVKGGHVTVDQLAARWLSRASKISQNSFSSEAYIAVLKEAEQFLWAGSEMDSVRDTAKNLIEARKWAEGIRDCLSKVENWSCHSGGDLDKVHFEHVNVLLSFNPVPCNEPGHLKLKEYAEEARLLVQEIDHSLSTCSEISELEFLYSRACGLPIFVKEIEKLSLKLSSTKVLIESIRKCISEKHPATIELDILYKLKSQILDLQVHVPEIEMLLDLLRQAELCRDQCAEILKGPINLKNLKLLLQELNGCTVNVPELKLLTQYHIDAVSWISRFNDVRLNINEREDHHNVVDELRSILEDGASLRIQVDELPLVKVELKKACCRERALKARCTKMSLDFIQQLMVEAAVIQIEKEKLFVDMDGVLAAAVRWEERAKDILSHAALMHEFEDVMRASEEIHAILPSLDDVKDAVLIAKSWLKKSEPFLMAATSAAPASSSLFEVEALKELVSQSKLLKISLEESRVLETVLKNCKEWEHDACSVLQDAMCILVLSDIGDGIRKSLILKIESIVSKIESVIKGGSSLHFKFCESPELQGALSTLQWCKKVLSFCSGAPDFEDVESLMKAAEQLPHKCASGPLCSSLLDGVKWLKKALEAIAAPLNFKKCKLSDAEEVLVDSQYIKVSFPVVVGQLQNSIQKHKLWQEQVLQFFNRKSEDRSWSLILELKELGNSVAFSCTELDLVLSKVGKIEKWIKRCIYVVGTSIEDEKSLLDALWKIKKDLDRSMYIYETSRACKSRNLCICCSSDAEDLVLLTCSICKDCYHLRCLGPMATNSNLAEVYTCPYCQFLQGGSICQNKGGPLKFGGKHPELQMLIELLHDAEDFSVWIEERDALKQLVDQALACRSCLTELVDFALAYCDKDLSIVSEKLTIAMKAIEVAGLYDQVGNRNLDLALARFSWSSKVNLLLQSSKVNSKPTTQQIQQHLKEGLAMNIPPEDQHRQRLTEVMSIGLQWAEHAKKVAADSGDLSLDKVFELMAEGERLPVCVEKEIKLLRARSVLYCICRKPYDQRAMIACDVCDEWYHFDCIKLHSAPKVYTCPACKPQKGDMSATQSVDHDRSIRAKLAVPTTPFPENTGLIKKPRKAESSPRQKILPITDKSNSLSIGNEHLKWRTQKPFRRASKKRAELSNLCPFLHIQQ